MSDHQEKSGWGVGAWIGCGCGGCILLIVLVVGLAVGLGGLAFLGIRKSDVFEEAMRRARSSPDVVDVLGEPIAAGLLLSGTFEVTPSSGEADFSIPISGPKGKGKLYVVASKSAGQWEFSTLEVEVEETGSRIDLLAAEIHVWLLPTFAGPAGAAELQPRSAHHERSG